MEQWPVEVLRIREASFPGRLVNFRDQNRWVDASLVTAVVGDTVVGYCFTTPGMLEASAAYVNEVAVDKAHRNHGIGELLIVAAVEWLHEVGCKKVFVDALEDGDGERRLRWFVRLGFEPHEEEMHSAGAAEFLSARRPSTL